MLSGCSSHLAVHGQLCLVAYQSFAPGAVHCGGACASCVSCALVIFIRTLSTNEDTTEWTLKSLDLFLNFTDLGGNMIDLAGFLLGTLVSHYCTVK